MPSNYPHHRFGIQVFPSLPPTARRSCFQFRRLFDFGLQGPDFFFYHNFMHKTKLVKLGSMYHQMSGREFFAQACELLKQNPSEGGMACLYGLLANYCLNTQLSPVFREAMAQGNVSRTELEVELDRYLLSLDGKMPAHLQDLTPSLKMTRGECVTVALFFPPVTPANAYAAYSSMIFWSRRMAAKKRGFTQLLLKGAKGTFAHQMMPDHANHKCLHLDSTMADCCSRALELYPEMARQLTAYREVGTPLGELFAQAFH